jgi:hypothetical protein
VSPSNPDLVEERARYTIKAAELLRSHIETISDLCNWAQEDEAVLAVVNRDLSFGGAVVVPLNRLREEVMSRLTIGWTMVFSPGSTSKDIQARCDKMSQLAQAKLDVIQRWRAKHKAGNDE